MFVRIIMENENAEIQYEIEREIIIKKSGGGNDLDWNKTLKAKIPTSITTTEAIKFAYKDPDTDELIRISAPDLVKDRLKVLFPEILSSYILFDAELLSAFEDQEAKSTLVQEGIETLTGLPLVTSAIENIGKENKKTVKENTSGKLRLTSLMQDVDKLETTIKKLEKENKDDGKTILKNDKEIEKITEYLLSHNEEAVRKLEEQKEQLRVDLKGLKNTIEESKKEMYNMIFDNLHKYYLRDSFITTAAKFEEYKKKGLIPSNFTKEALKGLLDENECVCGRPLSAHESKQREIIEKTMNNVYEAAISSEMGTVRDSINRYVSETDENSSKIMKTGYEKLEGDLAEARLMKQSKDSTLKKLEAETDETINDEVARKKQERTQLRNTIDIKKNDWSRRTQKLDVFIPRLKVLNEEYKIVKKQEVKDVAAKNKIGLADYVEDILKQASEQLLTDFINEVQVATQEYFLNTAPQKEEFAGVKIDSNNFTISALRKHEKEKLISAGQAHCLGLSYIAGIRRITKRNYFMMVDSPFHNISQESKLSICVELPTKMDTTQVTLFTTDTEYLAEIKKSEFTKGSKSAREVLKENKLVGREYNLVDNIFAEIEGEKYRDVKIERIS